MSRSKHIWTDLALCWSQNRRLDVRSMSFQNGVTAKYSRTTTLPQCIDIREVFSKMKLVPMAERHNNSLSVANALQLEVMIWTAFTWVPWFQSNQNVLQVHELFITGIWWSEMKMAVDRGERCRHSAWFVLHSNVKWRWAMLETEWQH